MCNGSVNGVAENIAIENIAHIAIKCHCQKETKKKERKKISLNWKNRQAMEISLCDITSLMFDIRE